MELEEKQQMGVFLGTSSCAHRNLLYSLQCHRLAVFESFLKRYLERHPPVIDINHVYTHPLNKTLLDIACCDGLDEFVKLLLQFEADPNKLNIAHNRGPIHFAAELGHVNVLRVLLEEPRINPNLEAGRETALHFAVRKNDIKCVKVLLDHNANPNIPNAKGATPIHVAALVARQEIIGTLLKFSRLEPDLDNFWDFRKQTPRQLITDRFPDFQLPLAVQKRVDFNLLRFYLDANDEQNFLNHLISIDGDASHEINESTLIAIAAGKNFRIAVKELIKRIKNAEIDVDLTDGASVAIKCGHPEVLKELLESNSLKFTEEMFITSCRELGFPSSLLGTKQSDRLNCFKIILDQPNINVRCQDEKGNTPLHYAARAECTEAVKMLLELGSYLGHLNILGVPPIADISPGILQQHFDDCIQSNNEGTDDYQINFDYTCLIPQTISPIDHEEIRYDSLLEMNSAINSPIEPEMYVLHYIAFDRSLKNLLKHPLLSSYLYIKWHRLRPMLYMNGVFYIFFYILLNWYILTTNNSKLFIRDSDININDTEFSTPEDIFLIREERSVLWCFLITFLTLLSLREILQFISSPRYYIMNFENWVEIMLVLLTITIVIGAGQPVGALAILLSAWELVILISQHPRMSTGIEMFKTVSTNLMAFLLPYAFLIFAFAMAFFTLFRGSADANFPNPGQSLFKTIIMITGEFDANDIPFVLHPVFSHIVFILFVFLIAIVLFNLLIGLAVSDTADILSRAELVGLISRTKLISYVEKIVLGSSITKSPKCWNMLYKNQIFRFKFFARRMLLFPHYLPDAKIVVKPYKGNKIHISGRNYKTCNSTSFMMDPKIISNSREILSTRGKITEYETILGALEKLKLNVASLANMMDSYQCTSSHNK